MKRTLITAIACAFLLSSAAVVVPDLAYAKNDKNQAELKDCKSIADPKAKDECVKQSGKKGEKEKKEKKPKK